MTRDEKESLRAFLGPLIYSGRSHATASLCRMAALPGGGCDPPVVLTVGQMSRFVKGMQSSDAREDLVRQGIPAFVTRARYRRMLEEQVAAAIDNREFMAAIKGTQELIAIYGVKPQPVRVDRVLLALSQEELDRIRNDAFTGMTEEQKMSFLEMAAGFFVAEEWAAIHERRQLIADGDPSGRAAAEAVRGLVRLGGGVPG